MEQTIPMARLVRPTAPPRNATATRYRGEDRGVMLSQLAAGDRTALEGLYALLAAFDESLARCPTPEDLAAAASYARSFDLSGAFLLSRSLGRGLAEQDATLRRAVHDCRGGALVSLLVEVERARARPRKDSVRIMRVLTRTQLKLLRNAFVDLDTPRREADSAERLHPIERLEEALSSVTGAGRVGPVRVVVHRTFTGAVTSCCTELGALDRAALNLVNNAVQHAANSQVDVALVSTTGAPGGDLAVFVGNAIAEADAAALQERFGEDISSIFVEPFTTTGSGDGLKICLDFVSSAYGLAYAGLAVETGAVGATIDDGWFVAWMHWPAVA